MKTRKYVASVLLCFACHLQALAGNEMISQDGGRTWSYPKEPALVSKSRGSLENLSGIQANYIKILDFSDPQFSNVATDVVFGDANHNGKIEMYRGIYVSETQAFTRVYEFNNDLTYTTTDLQFYAVPWALGDIDKNGLADIVVQSGDLGLGGNGYLRVYEAPNPNSFPSVLKQEIILPGRKVFYYARIVDADADGKLEVLMSANGFDDGSLNIYEWNGSQLVLIWTAPEISTGTSTKAVSDFDNDSKIEIATVTLATIYHYENVGDNQYALVQTLALPSYTYWNYEALLETNVDQGNPEFAVGLSYLYGTGTRYEWIIYKALTDNTFTQWYNTAFPQNIWVGVITHTTGDYDGDGQDEILVDDHPTLKMLEYVNGQMQVTWTRTQPDPIYATSADMRMDGVMNLAISDFGNPMSFWEEQRLANSYLNKSLDAGSTFSNSARHILKGGGKLHEEFTSGGDIFYRRSSNNGVAWELTKRISDGTANQGAGCIAVAHASSVHLVWQKTIDATHFSVLYSRSLDNGSTWSAPVVLPNASNVEVSWSQAYRAMPVIAELSLFQPQGPGSDYTLVVVYASSAGLRYRTSVDNGATWQIPSPEIISGLADSYVWFPSLASGGSFLSLTYDYRYTTQGVYSRTYSGTSWSNETQVTDIAATIYNRHSSIAVDPDGHPIASWCAQGYANGQFDGDYRILFRYGNSNNSWNPWFVEFAKISGVHSLYPSLTYYNKGAANSYGVDVLHHTWNPSTNAQTVRMKKYQGGNWWTDEERSATAAWANTSLENFTSGLPMNMWTDQSSSPSLIEVNSQGLPKQTDNPPLAMDGRRVVIQHKQTGSFVAFELNDMHFELSDNTTVPVAFKPHDFRQPLNVTLANVWEYLGTEALRVPGNASRLVFTKSIFTNPSSDTSGRGIPASFPLRQFRFRVLDAANGRELALLDTSGASGTISVNIASHAGRNVFLRSLVTLPGISNPQISIGVGDIIYGGTTSGQNLSSTAGEPLHNGLAQNYPNPFNPLTTIRYAVPNDGMVTLAVYDVLGREVALLVNESKQSGSYTVTFDASKLPSGMYFYRLKANGLNDVKKMVVAK